MSNLSQQKLKEVEERARRWAESPAGHEAVETALKVGREMVEQLEVARRIDWQELERPYTI